MLVRRERPRTHVTRELGGSLDASARLEGAWPRIALQGDFQAKSLRWGDIRVASGQGNWQLGQSVEQAQSINLHMEQLDAGAGRIGVADLMSELIAAAPYLLIPLAGLLPLAFGYLCGSGMATATSLFPFFVGPALDHGVHPGHVGAVVSPV